MSFKFASTLDPEKAFLVPLSETAGPFDPSFHRPYFRRRSAELESSSYAVISLGGLKGRIFQGVGRNLVDGAPTCLLKVKNITTDGEIDFSDTEPVADVPKSKLLQSGDIISPFIGAAIKGYKFARFSGSEQPCAVDNNTGIIRITDSRISSEYLHAFSQTCLVRWQLDQLTGGGGVPFLGSEYARRIRLPLPSAQAQEAIVSMMRAAKRRKNEAEDNASALLRGIDDILLDELGIPRQPEPPNTLESRMFQRTLAELSGGRLDPIANQDKRSLLEKAINSANCDVFPLRKLVEISKLLVTQIPPGEPYLGLENIEGETGDYVPTSEKETVGTAARFTSGQILFPKLRPYLNKTHLAAFSGICSTEFHVFTPVGISADYLTFFLRSRAIVGITSLLMTGNTLPRLQMYDIERLPIPVPSPDKQKHICRNLTRIREQAHALREQARADLEKAKREIEDLILGKEGGE